MAVAFLGRTSELDLIEGSIQNIRRHGGAGAVMIVGDPGAGKSRLLEQACSGISIGHRLQVTGYVPERQVPFAAAADLLRALARVPHDGARLDAMLFGTEPPTDHLEPLRVFEGAYRCVETLGETLLTIDDLQWADDTTRALCHYLIRAAARSDEAALIVVGAARPSQEADDFVASLSHVLGPAGRLSTIELGPLDQDSGVALALQLRPGLERSGAVELYERAGGSPFWLEMLADRDAGDVERLVERRLQATGPDAASLLALLAVAGRPVPPDELNEVLTWPPARAEAATVELVNAGIALTSAGAVRVVHDIIRDLSLDGIPGVQRRRLHGAIAHRLERAAGDDVGLLREALGHLRAGGLPAVDLALRLARSPHRRLLGEAGLEELAAIADDADAALLESRSLEWEVASLASELGRQSVAVQRWAHLSEHAADPIDRARAALAASRAAYELRDAGKATSFLARGRVQAGGDGVLEIELDAHESSVLRLEHLPAEASAAASRALSAARAIADKAGGAEFLDVSARRAYVNALRARYTIALGSNDLGEMLRISEETAAAAQSSEDHLIASLNAAYAIRFLGRTEEAHSRLRRVWGEARKLIFPTVAVESGLQLARTLHNLGRLAEAMETAADTLDLGLRFGVRPERMSIHNVRCVLHEIEVSHEDWRGGIAGIEETISQEPDPHYRLMQRQAQATWLARFGRDGAAEQVIAVTAAGHADVDEAGCDRCRSEFMLRAAEACARVGRIAQARRLLADWDERHRAPTPVYALWHAMAEGALACRDGPVETSLPLVESAHEQAQRLSFRLEALWCRLDLGDVLAALDRERAVEVLKDAVALAGELGARSEAERAGQTLRSLGVRTWARGPGGGEGALSERELEIARLVAGGAGNREIAEGMFLSRKTIERHVSNILAKLGLRNRTELAATFGRERKGDKG